MKGLGEGWKGRKGRKGRKGELFGRRRGERSGGGVEFVAAVAERLEQGGVFGVGGEVVELVGIGLEVEELFEGRVGIDVAGVGVACGAHAEGAGDLSVVAVGMVVEEVLAPGGVGVFERVR